MAVTERDGRGCLRRGCLVVGGATALVLALGLVLAAIGLALGVPDAEIVDETLARELPAPRAARAAEPPPPEDELRARLRELEPTRIGRVVLDLSMGSFEIVAGPADEPIRIEASYDRGSFELREALETADDGWTYEVGFGRSISALRFIRGVKIRNRVRLVLPRDLPFVLEGRIGAGQSRVDLGGLWVTDVDLDIGFGEHRIGFGEATPEPLEAFRLRGAAGELTVGSLGNASPKEVAVRQSMGQLTLGLQGAWRQGATVRVAHGMGELAIRLPADDVEVDLERAVVLLGERNLRGYRSRPRPPAGAPKLRLLVRGMLGEVRVN